MKTPTPGEITELVAAVAVFADGENLPDEAVLDSVIKAYFTDAMKAVLIQTYVRGPASIPTAFDRDAVFGLLHLDLVSTICLGGDQTALALNDLGMPYGKLLAARV